METRVLALLLYSSEVNPEYQFKADCLRTLQSLGEGCFPLHFHKPSELLLLISLCFALPRFLCSIGQRRVWC